ncbi:MAG TPA: diiron oxygenase, partial [Acidimicrobiales bacterium]
MTVTVEQSHTDTETDTDTALRAADKKIDRLNAASLRRVIEPDTKVTGGVGEGQVIPSEMLTVADLGLDLSDRERATLSREELASVVISGIRFETFLMSGFAAQMACTADLTDPRIVYMLHEMGEETRHSRLFIRLVDQLQPKATDPLQTRLGQ